MIDITVKTLDSQNHNYSVPDDFTVRNFKEKIANSVGIPADKQRLIYCGRVLQDNNKLSEYDVNGKVIHLVQRPPPSSLSSQSASSSTSSPSSSQAQGHRPGFSHRSGGPDGNSFLLGAFTIPSEVMDPNQVQQIVQQVVSGMGDLGRNATVMSRTSDDGSTVDVHINLGQVPLHGDTHHRIALVQNMISRANSSLNRLENPNSVPSNEEVQNEENSGAEQQVSSDVNTHVSDVTHNSRLTSNETHNEPSVREIIIQPSGGFSSIADAARMATAAAFAAAATTAARVTRLSTVGMSQYNASSNEGRQSSQQQQQQQPAPPPPPHSEAGSEMPSEQSQSNGSTRPAAQLTHPGALASVLDDLQTLQTRFQPHLVRYQELLRSDPNFQGNVEEQTNAQTLFNHVSSVLHYISHAYHAVSDIMMDMSQAPPRVLRSRPLLMQQPAVLQAGVPVQAHINVSTTLNAARAAATHQENNSSDTVLSSANLSMANSPSNASASNSQRSGSGSTPTTSSGQTSVNVPLLSAMPNQMASLLSSSNPVVFMEVGPSTITIDSISAAIPPEAGGSQPVHITGSRFPTVVIPQGPSPDAIQSLMHAVGQASAQRSGSNGQSQARGNTATHPTTSTQTRSTSRPIQTIPLAIPGFQIAGFDPYLPCSSLHIARRQIFPMRSAPQQQQQQQMQQQGNGRLNIPPNAQFMGVMANMMTSLFGASNESDSTATPSSRTNEGSSRTPPSRPVPLLSAIMQMAQEYMTLSRGGSVESQTVTTNFADFLNSLTTYHEGQDFFVDMLMSIAPHISVREFMEILLGRVEVLNRVRPHLQEFVRTRVLHGNEPNEGNIYAAVEELANPIIGIISVENVEMREGVDYMATMSAFIKEKLLALIRMILSSEADGGFGNAIYTMCQRIISEALVLSMYCFRNGQVSLERVFQSKLQHFTSELDPLFQPLVTSMCMMQLQALLRNVTVREGDILHYVIPAAESTPPTAKDESAPKTNSVPVPLESMEIDHPGADALPEVEQDTSFLTSSPSWHDSVPTEWVPIITEDVQRQRRQSVQRPFSDAYLANMPSKRRKLASNGRLQTVVNPANFLPETVRRAVAAAGVQPTTSLNDLTQDVATNSTLNAVFEEHLHGAMCGRLNEDKDYQPEKFPNAELVFHYRHNGEDV